jgi:hypothetical protein
MSLTSELLVTHRPTHKLLYRTAYVWNSIDRSIRPIKNYNQLLCDYRKWWNSWVNVWVSALNEVFMFPFFHCGSNEITSLINWSDHIYWFLLRIRRIWKPLQFCSVEIRATNASMICPPSFNFIKFWVSTIHPHFEFWVSTVAIELRISTFQIVYIGYSQIQLNVNSARSRLALKTDT